MVASLSYIVPLEVNVSLLTIKYGYSARIDENMFLEVHEHFGLKALLTLQENVLLDNICV